MHYVYHPDHESKIVTTAEYQKHLDSGWFDTPAGFDKKEEEVKKKVKEEAKEKADTAKRGPNSPPRLFV